MQHPTLTQPRPEPIDAGHQWIAAMRRGDHDAAWAISDAVLAARDPATRDDPRLPYHLRWVWDGRTLDHRHVLVRCYHGLGDTIQFARYLPLLRSRAASLAVEAPAPLLPLLATLPGPDRLIPFQPHAPAPAPDRDIEIMELWHALRVAPEHLLRPPPYFTLPDAVRPPVKIRSHGPLVGLCWRAGEWLPDRSVPLAQLLDAIEQPGLRLLSLQRGPAAAEARAPRFLNPQDASLGIIATAALILATDLVITVDSMVAHLAGALGHPAWLLLKADADWRWMEHRADSPWYPSLRLFRQPLAGDWRDPLSRVAGDFKRLAG